MTAVLLAKISDGSTTYTLKCDRAEHQFQRQPTVSPLPGDASGIPSVLLIDFGMSMETINISGIIDVSASTGTGGAVFPSKQQMETVARTWWVKTTDWVTGSGMPTLQFEPSTSYRGVIKSLSFQYEAAHETFYPFTLQWAVHSEVA